MTRMLSLVVGLVLAASPATAQSNIRNGRIETRPAGDLAATFQGLTREAGPFWIGYAVPAQDPDWNGCCHGSNREGVACCGRCLLEEGRSRGDAAGPAATRGPIPLESGRQAVVLYRVEGGVQRVRTYSESCELDAGGRTVYWLTGVPTQASIDLLLRLAGRQRAGADGDRHDHVVDGAILAIAVHRDPAADRALAALIAPDQAVGLRKKAAFWAAVARGRPGFELVRAALLDASNAEGFRKHVTFAVSQSREADAVDTLIGVARADASPAVRGEAIFWLAQKAGRKAAEAITEAIERDPETTVKERAVFALSQLPKEEGVPKLIDLARTNRNPAVRKQAMFWLGQSRDPRALQFFEEVLARP